MASLSGARASLSSSGEVSTTASETSTASLASLASENSDHSESSSRSPAAAAMRSCEMNSVAFLFISPARLVGGSSSLSKGLPSALFGCCLDFGEVSDGEESLSRPPASSYDSTSEASSPDSSESGVFNWALSWLPPTESPFISKRIVSSMRSSVGRDSSVNRVSSPPSSSKSLASISSTSSITSLASGAALFASAKSETISSKETSNSTSSGTSGSKMQRLREERRSNLVRAFLPVRFPALAVTGRPAARLTRARDRPPNRSVPVLP